MKISDTCLFGLLILAVVGERTSVATLCSQVGWFQPLTWSELVFLQEGPYGFCTASEILDDTNEPCGCEVLNQLPVTQSFHLDIILKEFGFRKYSNFAFRQLKTIVQIRQQELSD